MSDFACQQSAFQNAILSGDDDIPRDPRQLMERREVTLFGVYRYAQGSRCWSRLSAT